MQTANMQQLQDDEESGLSLMKSTKLGEGLTQVFKLSKIPKQKKTQSKKSSWALQSCVQNVAHAARNQTAERNSVGRLFDDQQYQQFSRQICTSIEYSATHVEPTTISPRQHLSVTAPVSKYNPANSFIPRHEMDATSPRFHHHPPSHHYTMLPPPRQAPTFPLQYFSPSSTSSAPSAFHVHNSREPTSPISPPGFQQSSKKLTILDAIAQANPTRKTNPIVRSSKTVTIQKISLKPEYSSSSNPAPKPKRNPLSIESLGAL